MGEPTSHASMQRNHGAASGEERFVSQMLSMIRRDAERVRRDPANASSRSVAMWMLDELMRQLGVLPLERERSREVLTEALQIRRELEAYRPVRRMPDHPVR